jgi:hypothetical protein
MPDSVTGDLELIYSFNQEGKISFLKGPIHSVLGMAFCLKSPRLCRGKTGSIPGSRSMTPQTKGNPHLKLKQLGPSGGGEDSKGYRPCLLTGKDTLTRHLNPKRPCGPHTRCSSCAVYMHSSQMMAPSGKSKRLKILLCTQRGKKRAYIWCFSFLFYFS